MSAFHALFARREAKAALAVWALLPTLFLFFTILLAVDPSTKLDRVRLGVASLDAGVQTPQGTLAIGARLIEGMRQQAHFEIAQYPSEAALRDAVLTHDVSGGIVFPAGMTKDVQTKQPVAVRVVRSDANDPFTNAFITNLTGQISTNINTAVSQMASGQQPGAAQPATPTITVTPENVAATTDFRFPTLPAAMLLPLWIATLAFAVLMSRAGDGARRESGMNPTQMGLAELGAGLIGATIAAAVITVDVALFTWRWDLNLLGLFGLLWVGLVASAWLLQGTIRLLGVELGVALGITALFVQQAVSGATYPAPFAPDAVRWAEGFAPLRYMVEGMRNLLIGGSTTWDMAYSLAALAGAGLLMYAAGVGRLSLMPRRARPAQVTNAA